MTKSSWWARAWQGPQLLGATLCAALGFRIMTGAIAEARAARVAPPVSEPRPVLLEVADQLMAKETKPPPEPAPAPASAAKSLRLFLSVLAGPERSEIFVNGTRLGLSPYLGDFTCKSGEQLQIEIVPVKGPLITRQAKCVGQTVLIRD